MSNNGQIPVAEPTAQSFDDLLHAEQRRERRLRWATGVGFLLLLAFGTAFWWWNRDDSDQLSETQIQQCVLDYLVDGTFAGDEYSKQLLGPVKFYGRDSRDGFLYFYLLGTNDQAEAVRATQNFLLSGSSLEFGTRNGSSLSLGVFQPPLPAGNAALFFRSKIDSFAVPRTKRFSFSFLAADYSPTVEDLAEFKSNRTIRCGWLYFHSARATRSVNFGAFVATPGEASLSALVRSLCRLVPEGAPRAREQRIQILLRLVTDEIEYDDSPLARSVEVVKRPSEVLITRRGDCANKVVLFASLLEQLGEGYLLLYSGDHIAVAVLKGEFGSGNGLTITYDAQTWAVCETTCSRFIPGETVLEHNYLEELRFVQQPRASADIIDIRTGAVVSFVQ